MSMKKRILSKSVLISINKIEQDTFTAHLLLNVKEIIEVFIQLFIAFVIKCSDGVTIIIAQIGIYKLSSNLSPVFCICFHNDAIGKGMNPAFYHPSKPTVK